MNIVIYLMIGAGCAGYALESEKHSDVPKWFTMFFCTFGWPFALSWLVFAALDKFLKRS